MWYSLHIGFRGVDIGVLCFQIGCRFIFWWDYHEFPRCLPGPWMEDNDTALYLFLLPISARGVCRERHEKLDEAGFWRSPSVWNGVCNYVVLGNLTLGWHLVDVPWDEARRRVNSKREIYYLCLIIPSQRLRRCRLQTPVDLKLLQNQNWSWGYSTDQRWTTSKHQNQNRINGFEIAPSFTLKSPLALSDIRIVCTWVWLIDNGVTRYHIEIETTSW